MKVNEERKEKKLLSSEKLQGKENRVTKQINGNQIQYQDTFRVERIYVNVT